MDFLAGLHPKIVHFPIALLSVYALLEILGILFKNDFMLKTAHLFLFLGVLGTLAAVLTGNQAEETAELLQKQGAIIQLHAISEHSDFANYTVWFFSALLVGRTFLVLKKKFQGAIKYLFIVLALIGLFLVFETGEYGGKLVYKYGIGTDLKKIEITE